jgi:hypothetical protein
MKAWSNIQIAPEDPEIININNLEKRLGELPDKVNKIRELITRFEICHFKYQEHLRKIKDSIIDLEPNVDSTKIGTGHVQHGESAWKNDATGRSLIGQQYIWALKEWLNDNDSKPVPEKYNNKLEQHIRKWLGDRNPDKIRLIRLLLARLTWDWKSYEELQHGGELKDIELQVCRMDICHYAFPQNLDLLLEGIGQLKPVKDKEFEGCGSCNDNIKTYLEKEFKVLNDKLKSLILTGKSDKNELIRTWLIACLAKTIKENINLSISIIDLVNLAQ